MAVEEEVLSEPPFVQAHMFYRQWIMMMQKGVWERPGKHLTWKDTYQRGFLLRAWQADAPREALNAAEDQQKRVGTDTCSSAGTSGEGNARGLRGASPHKAAGYYNSEGEGHIISNPSPFSGGRQTRRGCLQAPLLEQTRGLLESP